MKPIGKFIISRFGNEIAEIENSLKALELWFRENVIYEIGKPFPNVSQSEVFQIAEDRGYAVRRNKEAEQDHSIRMHKIERIMDAIKIEDIASHLFEIKQRGNNFIAEKCPFCGGEHIMYLAPSKGIYKCFGCGKSGTGIGLLQEVKGITYEQALSYIEKNLINKNKE